MKGGDSNLTKIENDLINIQQNVNDALQLVKSEQSASSSSSDFMSDYNNEPSLPTEEEPSPDETSMTQSSMSEPKPWQDDKNTKFSDGTGGRVKLSFPRILTLIQNNINKGNTSKNWTSIKEQLLDATSISAVNSVIKSNALNFTSNTVYGGTRKRRRGGKRKSSKRR
jgi:fumarylacetoacetate (FAA) hydrolase family protein